MHFLDLLAHHRLHVVTGLSLPERHEFVSIQDITRGRCNVYWMGKPTLDVKSLFIPTNDEGEDEDEAEAHQFPVAMVKLMQENNVMKVKKKMVLIVFVLHHVP